MTAGNAIPLTMILQKGHALVGMEKKEYSEQMQKTISTEELKKRIDAGADDFVLVDTLKPQSYEARHLPKAINIPEDAEFAQKYAATGAPKDKEVIVYCSSETCGAHKRAADALEAAGYTNVVRFSGGLAGWQNAGFAFETSQ